MIWNKGDDHAAQELQDANASVKTRTCRHRCRNGLGEQNVFPSCHPQCPLGLHPQGTIMCPMMIITMGNYRILPGSDLSCLHIIACHGISMVKPETPISWSLVLTDPRSAFQVPGIV